MQILNLIRPEKSDVKYEVIQFPDGEPHIALKNIDRKDNMTCVMEVVPLKVLHNYLVPIILIGRELSM